MGDRIKAATKTFFEKYKAGIMPVIIGFLLGWVMPVSSNVVKICEAPSKIEQTRIDLRDNYATKTELRTLEATTNMQIEAQKELTKEQLNTIESKVTMIILMLQEKQNVVIRPYTK